MTFKYSFPMNLKTKNLIYKEIIFKKIYKNIPIDRNKVMDLENPYDLVETFHFIDEEIKPWKIISR